MLHNIKRGRYRGDKNRSRCYLSQSKEVVYSKGRRDIRGEAI